MKKQLIFIAIIILISASAGARIKESPSSELPENVNELNLVSSNPTTMDEMIKAASLILHGTVLQINEVITDSEGRISRRTESRNRFVATVHINDIYKGGYPEDEITVEFMRSNKTETPALMNLRENEEAILFLIPGIKPPHFAPVSYHSGKVLFNNDNVELLKSKTDGPENDPGKVTISLSVKKEASETGTSVYATILIMNNTIKPIRLDSSLSPAKILTVITAAGDSVASQGSMGSSSPEYILVLPQHFIGARYDLTKHYDLKNGNYSVRASFMNPGWSHEKSPDIITSKTVVFDIDDM